MFEEEIPISPQPEEVKEEKGIEEKAVEARKEGSGGIFEKMRNMPKAMRRFLYGTTFLMGMASFPASADAETLTAEKAKQIAGPYLIELEDKGITQEMGEKVGQEIIEATVEALKEGKDEFELEITLKNIMDLWFNKETMKTFVVMERSSFLDELMARADTATERGIIMKEIVRTHLASSYNRDWESIKDQPANGEIEVGDYTIQWEKKAGEDKVEGSIKGGEQEARFSFSLEDLRGIF